MKMETGQSGHDGGQRPATAGQAVKVAPDATGRTADSGADPATRAMGQALERASQLGQPLVDLG